ncbi:MAG: Tol-Pal system protein TolB [Alphaproteobacteria bacterium]|nr:Tol-Pal system protein TolB [Alphaproteobacteria bacterium]
MFARLLFVALALLPFTASAELTLNLNQGVRNPLPIAIPYFHVDAGASPSFATDIPNVIANNLSQTGMFKVIDQGAYMQDAVSLAAGPKFDAWKTINAQALVSGIIKPMPDGRTRVEYRLWDVLANKQMAGTAYMTNQQNWRRIAHIISDDIYKRLTGEQGYFDTRIVYISESGPFNKRVKRLAIMDQDGYNHRYLTDGANLVLTPRFSPSTQMITYLAYVGGKPRVYLYDLNTGRQEVLGDFPGMSFAPRFSPDGQKIVYSLARNGNTDIYVMDLKTRRAQQLTNTPSIETAPSFSPDGRFITFESDRSGTQQIYVMDASGANQKRISFEKGRYASPVWSPRGDTIAFIKMRDGQWYIGVIRPDGSGERLITSSYHVEGPSWAPNGRVLTFFKEGSSRNGRTAKVYTIDLTGFNERVMKTPQDASDPAWSPPNPS